MSQKNTVSAPQSTSNRKSNKIRKAMNSKKLRADDVAYLAKCGVSTIYRILRNGGLPKNRNVRAAVCRVLGLQDAES